ncbi:hypothetical protein TNIN_441591 [Trichonephila inaurata madagascariensis]|uniref:Uncharacterized protein n=1 Tax=Trichonephila inaurata madagascariensis TaxID=2747483 RepID=A0A8X7CCX0_9ARAC|nr:hypothetical protein TNIN_441591 [Trichonephila inaurata madagascariensis]
MICEVQKKEEKILGTKNATFEENRLNDEHLKRIYESALLNSPETVFAGKGLKFYKANGINLIKTDFVRIGCVVNVF